ncbi:MAG: holin [Clostridia bacterium]|nr:holin [Clostridia bacterium]
MQNRLKSPALWVAVAALIAFVAKNWLHHEIPGWDGFVELIMAVLMAFGIINNPTDKENF